MAEVNEKEYTGSSASSIFGGPLSWVAAFGALTAIGSIVPIIIYPLGGGYLSLSQLLLFPLAGYMLGPWAGLVACGIGASIGLFIAPAAYPLGVIDVLAYGAIFGLSYGLLSRRWRYLALILWIASFPLIAVFPYRWPGAAAGFAPPASPAYLVSWSFYAFVFLIWAVWAFTPIHRWVRSDGKTVLRIAGFIIASLAGSGFPNGYGGVIYYFILKKPIEIAILENWQSVPLYAAALIVGPVVFAVFQSLGRTGLRRVPGSLFEEIASGTSIDRK